MLHLLSPRLVRLGLATVLVVSAGAVASGCESGLDAPGVTATVQSSEAFALLPSDARMIGMMDLRAARESDAIRTATGGAGLGMVSPNGSDDFDEFVRRTGFNPGDDLDRIYIAANESDKSAAFVGYGRFDRDRIARFVADQDDAELEATEIGGIPVYLSTGDSERGGFAFVNDEMILAGDEASLRLMLSRVGSTTGTPSAEVQALLDRVQYPDGAWFIARDLDVSGAEGDNPMGAAATMADDMVVSMDFRRDGVAFGAFVTPRAGTSADDLESVFKGGVAAARAGLKDEPGAIDMLDDVDVKARDGGVGIDAFVPSSLLASLDD